MNDIKPIPTKYAGTHFRSRLEARWAVFFNFIKLKWEYEPTALKILGKQAGLIDHYTPDFYLPEKDLWVEIKPVYPDYETMIKLASFVIENPPHERKSVEVVKPVTKPAPYVSSLADIEKAYGAAQRKVAFVHSTVSENSDLLLMFGSFFADVPNLQLWKRKQDGLTLEMVSIDDIFGRFGMALLAATSAKFD